MAWNGRELESYTFSEMYGFDEDGNPYLDATTYSFTYNNDGIRTSKTVAGVKHEYILNGSQIVAEKWKIGSTEYLLIYLYDEAGAPIGLKYRTSAYAVDQYDWFFFEKNLQGDVLAVYNSTGTKIGSYTYDAWGNHTYSTTSGITSLERKIVTTYNPFRYRGYYYDTETQWYYLQSRYYNPNWGRFVNADGTLGIGLLLKGGNLYAYCNNTPVMLVDPTGQWPDWGKIADGAINVVAGASGVLVGAGDFVVSLFETKGDIGESFEQAANTTVEVFSGINNAVNETYYYFATAEALPETADASAYVESGHISRWDRIEHAKYMTKDEYYTANAQNYYAEYSAHMYAWLLTGWADKTEIPWFNEKAKQARLAEITVGKPDSREMESWFIDIIGDLGI